MAGFRTTGCSVVYCHEDTVTNNPGRRGRSKGSSNNGHLVGPIDLFDDVAFDRAREQANEIADMLRRHGPFEPHRLPLEEMEYTTLPQIMGRLADRFKAT